MKVCVYTLGCKVNTYESEYIMLKLIEAGYDVVNNLDEPSDVYIINTCTVTNTADIKSRKIIHRIKRNNPNACIVGLGCYVEDHPDEFNDIDIYVGNKDKSKIADLITNYLEVNKPYVKFYNDRNLEFEDMMISSFNHVRAFIKIEDGCDNFCSYCIIPYVRGSVRCKAFDKVIKEAIKLAKNGHQEIVLTGIHTGRYWDNGHDLADLIEELCKIPEIKRIRISSIEITELGDRFLNVLRDNPKVCDHLHIPLQSGSDDVLKKMNRKYDLTYFRNKIREIRAIRPNIAISTDIIVGFPGESDQNFNECYNFAEEIEFSKIHVFPYSLREGTAAASMPEQVPENIKKDRVKKLMTLSENLEKKYYDKFRGKKVDVLVEECDNGISFGHTSNYLYVQIEENLEKGQIYSKEL